MALGAPKLLYVYTADNGDKFLIRLSADAVVTGDGLTAYDPASPPSPAPKGKINRRSVRVVYASGIYTPPSGSGRKITRAFVSGTTNSAIFSPNAPSTISYTPFQQDAISMTTTGKRGERVTF